MEWKIFKLLLSISILGFCVLRSRLFHYSAFIT